MTIKRKRSDPELCSSPSSASSIPSSPFTFGLSDANPSAVRYTSAAHLSSRTLKRFRNNRPSEDQVHQHTLGLLYSAQQQAHASQLIGCPEAQQAVPASRPGRQHTLHRYWSIDSPPTDVASPPAIQQTASTPLNCEDCGACLSSQRFGHDMDVNMACGVAENVVCGACAKHVCFSCSVSNLGEQKRCLKCAGREERRECAVGCPNTRFPIY